MGRLSAFVERRGSWGILILSFLAVVLALWSFANLLLLSAVVESESGSGLSQGWIWTVFILNVLLGLIFAVSAYGLWGRHNWGRRLFMACIVVWAGLYGVALFTFSVWSADYTAGAFILNVIPIIGAIAAVFYLNLTHIKLLFAGKELTDK